MTTRAQLLTSIAANFPDNSSRQISAADIRDFLTTLVNAVHVTDSDQALRGLPGLSAYEVAVANGFVGSQADWLASLGSAPAPVNLLDSRVLISGDDLVGPNLHAMLAQFVAAAEGTGTTAVSRTSAASSMNYRWNNDTTTLGEHAKAKLADATTDIFVISEGEPIEAQSGSNAAAMLWYRLAIDNGADAVYLLTGWASRISGTGDIPGDSNDHLAWRLRPLVDLSRWEAIADHVNANRAVGEPAMRIVPAGLALGRLHDAVRLGEAAGITDFGTFFTDNRVLSHLGTYYLACVLFGTIYGVSPVGLPSTLSGFTSPSAPQATMLQQLAWESVISYANSGSSGVRAPRVSFAEASTATPRVGTAVTVPHIYATGRPAPEITYSWHLDGAAGAVATTASYTPDASAIAGALTVRITATNTQGTHTLELPVGEVRPAVGAAVDFSFDSAAKVSRLRPFHPTFLVPETMTFMSEEGRAFIRGFNNDSWWLRFYEGAGDGNYRWLLRMSGTEPAANSHRGSEPVFRAIVGDYAGSPTVLQAYSTGPLRYTGTLRQRIRRLENGTITDLFATSVSPIVGHGQWYWHESQIVGSAIKCRIYPEGSSAPAWQGEVTDTTFPSGGDAGIGCRSTGTSLDIARFVFTPV